MATFRVSFTKTFASGTLKGLSLPIRYSVADERLAIERHAQLKAAATTGVTMADSLTGALYTVSNPRLVEVRS